MTEYFAHAHRAACRASSSPSRGTPVGKSTHEAMLSGAVFGYRGLITEIVRQVSAEAFPRTKPRIVATGGDAALIARNVPLFNRRRSDASHFTACGWWASATSAASIGGAPLGSLHPAFRENKNTAPEA